MVLAIRFLWDRKLNVGHSKQIEKLIWQLHRIASAEEHRMNLSFPAVQPGTEEARDLAYLQPTVAQPVAAPQVVATPSVAASVAASAAASATQPVAVQQPVTLPATPPAAAPPAATLPPLPQEISTEVPVRGGVNSMFGL